MKVEIVRGIGRAPLVIEDASRVLVTQDDGTPIAVASEWMPGAVTCGTAADGDFAQILRGLGVDRTVVVEGLKPPRFEDIQV
jgi:hypothetical protein